MSSPARYNHLPSGTAYLLSDWQYKGARPTAEAVGAIAPTVAFSTVDVKLPAEGPTKVLEINGYESGLDAYCEEWREDSIIERANNVNNSLGVPIARFRWQDERGEYREIRNNTIPHYGTDIRDDAEQRGMLDDIGDPFSLDSKLTALQSSEVRGWLNRQRVVAKGGTPELRTELQDISEAPLLIELSDPWMPI